MKIVPFTVTFCAAVICFIQLSNAIGAELTLEEVLTRAEKNDHSLSAAEVHEGALEGSIGSAKANLYPTLDLESIYSTGFPGSSGALGVGGLMGSPYRSGVAGGLVAKQTVWDFGRTSNAISAAKHDYLAQRHSTELSRMQIDREAAELFFTCARYRTLRDNWGIVLEEAKLIATEVKKFVTTGQRSVVERYLADSQVDEALTQQADYEQRTRLILKRIGILTGDDQIHTDCPSITTLNPLTLNQSGELIHPLVLKSQQEAQAAEARLSQAKSDYLPKIVAVGSIGAMEKSRLVNKDDYAVGFGVIFPLFSGFKTSSEVKRSQAIATEKEFLVQASHEQVDQLNAKFDEVIEATKSKTAHLGHELSLATEGFEVAKKRYFRLQGTLVDVREALRNLARTRTEMNEIRGEYLQALAAKAIFNGVKISRGNQ